MRALATIAVAGVVAALALRGGGPPECEGTTWRPTLGVRAGESHACVRGTVLGCFDAGTGSEACVDGTPRADRRRPLRVAEREEVQLRLAGSAVSLAAHLRDRPLRVRGGGDRWRVEIPDGLPGGPLELAVSARLEQPAGAVHAFQVALELS